jgi:hypothetical protein
MWLGLPSSLDQVTGLSHPARAPHQPLGYRSVFLRHGQLPLSPMRAVARYSAGGAAFLAIVTVPLTGSPYRTKRMGHRFSFAHSRSAVTTS